MTQLLFENIIICYDLPMNCSEYNPGCDPVTFRIHSYYVFKTFFKTMMTFPDKVVLIRLNETHIIFMYIIRDD